MRHLYVGTFLIAFAGLALEITLARVLSVLTWYHLAFFAIATALLGMTAGATSVYLLPDRFTPAHLPRRLAQACLAFALTLPPAAALLFVLPLRLTPSLMSLFALLLATVACALPFYWAGIAVTAVLTRLPLPIGRLYAADLTGAALGSLFVLGGLELIDAPSLLLVIAAVGAAAGAVLAGPGDAVRRWRRGAWLAAALLAVAAVGNTQTTAGLRPFVVKGEMVPLEGTLYEKWNSFSRIAVLRGTVAPPWYWGPSPLAPQEPIVQYEMNIDGEAGTSVRRYQSAEDAAHLRYDVTNFAYYLRPSGGALIIGVGGGRDVQAALWFGHERVVGVDVNPIFIDLLNDQFADFAGLAANPAVTLVVDEARSYASRSDEQFAVIQMALIDTWAATGAGAYSLTENKLYTVEAWQQFLARLTDDGLFTVSRWHNPRNLGETGRLVSLAVAALQAAGVERPADHLALVTAREISTLIVSKVPLTAADRARIAAEAAALQFTVAVLPGTTPDHPDLAAIVGADSAESLHQIAPDSPYNYAPPTDEQPYFFNMLRPTRLGAVLSDDVRGVIGGNLVATVTLVVLIAILALLAVVTVILPLAWQRRRRADAAPLLWPAALYFSLIGGGFMLVEIALIQRLSIVLSHPVYALGVLLFTIIASSGLGSALSDRLPLSRRPWAFVYPLVVVAAVLLVNAALRATMGGLLVAPMAQRIAAVVALIFPLGVLLGLFFPTGMRLARAAHPAADAQTPWFWALNGIFGVLCSAVAVFISIYHAVSTNFVIGAACYAALVLCNARLLRAASAD